MRFLSPLSLATSLFFTISTTTPTNHALSPIHRSPQKPIYAIAHMVLTNETVTAALNTGANALEVDVTAENGTWWADHSRTRNSAGDTVRDLFEFIAEQRRDHEKPVTFVWLDMKNPDKCSSTSLGEGSGCSIQALRDITREMLEPAGVRALYGFFGESATTNSHAYTVIRDSLNKNEAVAIHGYADVVVQNYENNSTSIPPKQRIMDYGYTGLKYEFGNCHERGFNTCTELRQGSDARDSGKLGKVMAWTSQQGDAGEVDKLLGEAGVDGIIYGYVKADFEDARGSRAAFEDISGFVKSHSGTHRMATIEDLPW